MTQTLELTLDRDWDIEPRSPAIIATGVGGMLYQFVPSKREKEGQVSGYGENGRVSISLDRTCYV